MFDNFENINYYEIGRVLEVWKHHHLNFEKMWKRCEIVGSLNGRRYCYTNYESGIFYTGSYDINIVRTIIEENLKVNEIIFADMYHL